MSAEENLITLPKLIQLAKGGKLYREIETGEYAADFDPADLSRDDLIKALEAYEGLGAIYQAVENGERTGSFVVQNSEYEDAYVEADLDDLEEDEAIQRKRLADVRTSMRHTQQAGDRVRALRQLHREHPEKFTAVR